MSWVVRAPAQPLELSVRAVPTSIRLWINGLRVTDLMPILSLAEDGTTVSVQGLEEDDLVTIQYVPEEGQC